MALLESQIQEIIKGYEDGKSTRELSKEFDTSIQNVCYHLRTRGVKMRTTHLPPSLVKEIGRMVETGMTIKEISNRLNIPYATIYGTCSYHGWVNDNNRTRVWGEYAKELGALAEKQRSLDEEVKMYAKPKEIKKATYYGKNYEDLTELYT